MMLRWMVALRNRGLDTGLNELGRGKYGLGSLEVGPLQVVHVCTITGFSSRDSLPPDRSIIRNASSSVGLS
jgi:hypothetical protein